MIYVLLSSSMLNLNLSIFVFNDIKPPNRPYKAIETYSVFIPFQAKRVLAKNVTKINIINDKIYIFFYNFLFANCYTVIQNCFAVINCFI